MNLPSHIGGYQHLEPDVLCASGDIYVCDGIPEAFVSWGVGRTVGRMEGGGWRIYRKIPCPQQGGISQPNTTECLQSSEQKYFIPQDSDERKTAPMFRGLLGYFPAALFEVARHSLTSDQKHTPGNVKGPHWARWKSPDHADCIVRHLIDAGNTSTPDRLEHLRSLAWRSLALLQEECERRGSAPGVSCKP